MSRNEQRPLGPADNTRGSDTDTGGDEDDDDDEYLQKIRRRVQTMKREQTQRKKEQEAKRYVRQRSAPLAKKFYIGLYSEAERKRLFLENFVAPTTRASAEGPVHSQIPTLENPYNENSWLDVDELKTVLGDGTQIVRLFAARYSKQWHQARTERETTAVAQLYSIESTADYFKHILSERGDLFMKVVSLEGLTPEQQQKVYNEIIAAYFLNELVYGYSQVLSLHFMTIVDWFPTVRTLDTKRDWAPHQIVVSEALDFSLADLMVGELHENHFTLGALQGALFQVFHALETAWATHRYTHNDLQPVHIMFKANTPDMPLYRRSLLYRRLADTHWYRVPYDDTNECLVKLIDLGRSRLFVSSSSSEQSHVSEAGYHTHTHDRLLCLDEMEHQVDRHIDVLLPLLGILSVPAQYWKRFHRIERAAFFAMCDRVIDFATINRIVRDFAVNGNALAVEYSRVGSLINAANLCNCPRALALLQEPGVFIHRFHDSGATASDVLNDTFFDSYRLKKLMPHRALTQDEIYGTRNAYAVVSFLEHPQEAVMQPTTLQASSDTPIVRRCTMCHSPTVTLQTAFCGSACYEFKYLFGASTVMRQPVYEQES